MRKLFLVVVVFVFLLFSTLALSSQKTTTPKPTNTPQKIEKSKIEIDKDVQEIKDDDHELKILTEYIYQRQVTLDRQMATRIAKAILYYAQKYYISYEILVGMADVETKFRPWATSNKNARGLMQIMYKIHKDNLEKVMKRKLQERDLYVVEISVESACIILRLYGILDKPETAIGKYFGQSQSTGDYVAKVFYATGRYVAYRQKIERMLFKKVIKP